MIVASDNGVSRTRLPRKRGMTIRFWLRLSAGCGAIACAGVAPALAQTDSWINSSSGKWEVSSNWSAGLPSVTQRAILVTNMNTKTVTIDNVTTNSPGTMTISNLTISAPGTSVNTFRLTNAGFATPLRVLNTLRINGGGALTIDQSAVSVEAVSLAPTDTVISVNGTGTTAAPLLLVASGQLVATNALTIIGSNSVGNATINGGTMLLGDVSVGDDTNGFGGLTVTGGTAVVRATLTAGNGARGTGVVWVTGGQLVVTNNTTSVGYEGIGSLTVSNGTFLARDVSIGDLFGSQGSFTVAGGTVTLNSSLSLGDLFDGSTGTVRVAGGQLLANNSVVTVGGAGIGRLTVTGGTVRANAVILGGLSGSQGTLTVAGGTMTVSTTLDLGNSPGSLGVLIVTGGQLVVTNDQTSIGNNGTGSATATAGSMLLRNVRVGPFAGSPGTLTVAGGAVSLSSNLVIGSATGATGTVWVTGGQLVVTDAVTEIGRFGVGRLTVSNGTVLARSLVVGRFTNSVGTITLAGGTVTTDNLLLTNTTSRFAFTNGTLNATATTVTNGLVFTVGSGKLSATYNLQGGAHTFANGLRISSNATLTGTGTISTSVTNAGAIAPGTGVGRLDVAGNTVFQAGSSLRIELGGYVQGVSYDYLNVAGAVTATGTLTVTFINNFVATVTNGSSFVVLTANSIAGAFGNATNGARLVTADGLGDVRVNYAGPSLVLSDLRTDTVGDGIPNWWRAQYFGSGTTTNSQSCAGCDPDGDGCNNLCEYLAGTNPTNSASAFRITAITREANNIRVMWMSGTGKTNALQRTAGGTSGSYSTNNYAAIFTVTNTVGTTTNYLDVGAATNMPARYYRVRLVP